MGAQPGKFLPHPAGQSHLELTSAPPPGPPSSPLLSRDLHLRAADLVAANSQQAAHTGQRTLLLWKNVSVTSHSKKLIEPAVVPKMLNCPPGRFR